MTARQADGLRAAREALYAPPLDEQGRADALALIDAQRKRDMGIDCRDLFRRVQAAREVGC